MNQVSSKINFMLVNKLIVNKIKSPSLEQEFSYKFMSEHYRSNWLKNLSLFCKNKL